MKIRSLIRSLIRSSILSIFIFGAAAGCTEDLCEKDFKEDSCQKYPNETCVNICLRPGSPPPSGLDELQVTFDSGALAPRTSPGPHTLPLQFAVRWPEEPQATAHTLRVNTLWRGIPNGRTDDLTLTLIKGAHERRTLTVRALGSGSDMGVSLEDLAGVIQDLRTPPQDMSTSAEDLAGKIVDLR